MATDYKEPWLVDALRQFVRPLFTDRDFPLPDNVRISTGWPSKGGLSAKKRVIGQAWSHEASSDGTHEIIISVWLDDPLDILATLVHECIHVAVGLEAKHGKPFRAGMRALGLEGKPTQTRANPDLKQTMRTWAEILGPYPHARLDGQLKTKQTGRMLKWCCDTCGLIVRSTEKWRDTYGDRWPCPCGQTLIFAPPATREP